MTPSEKESKSGISARLRVLRVHRVKTQKQVSTESSATGFTPNRPLNLVYYFVFRGRK